MNRLSKFTDLKGVIQNLRRKKGREKEVPPELIVEEENPSMIEGEKPFVHKIKKVVVYGIAGVVVVAFVTALYMSTDSSQPKTKKQEVKIADQSEVAKTNLKGSDTYEEVLAGYDKNKANGKPQQAIPAGVRGTTQTQARVVAQENYSGNDNGLQAIPSRSYQPNYSAQYALASVPQQAVQQPAEQKESIKENIKAAIRFALGGGSTEASAAADAQAAGKPATTSSAAAYSDAADNVLQVGTIIPVVLATGINTDVGGPAVAQIQSDVYDSFTGANLLIPAGSRLVGTYTAGAGNGQSRVSITWNTLILPNGGSYSLGNSMIAIDGAGYAGIEGNVNNHTGRQLSAGAISSALGAIASIASGNTSSTSSTYSAGQLAAQGAASNLMNTASSLFQKNMNIQPTITVDPGYEFNVFVTNAIAF